MNSIQNRQNNYGLPSKEQIDTCSNLNDLLELWEKAHNEELDTDYIYETALNSKKDSSSIRERLRTFFLPDGIIDESQYWRSPERILFVAKEANWFSLGDTPKQFNEYSSIVMFWHREVAFGREKGRLFSQRLSMLTNALLTSDYQTINKTHTALQSVSVINLKKRGGFTYCNFEKLEQYVKRYKDFISKEIELINPTMIVYCGGDVRLLMERYISLSDTLKALTVYHPSYRFISDANYLRQVQCEITGEIWKLKQ